MTWTYFQDTGQFYDAGNRLLTLGYSGFGPAKNDPHQQCLANVGPIPRGIYAIGNSFDDELKGPVVLPLIPSPVNDMCGRSGFLIHGDSASHPGRASNGCIILNLETRRTISGSEDRKLRVISLQRPSEALTQELVSPVRESRKRKAKGGKPGRKKSRRKSSTPPKRKTRRKPKGRPRKRSEEK